jgi:signal transduction histidine kinase
VLAPLGRDAQVIVQVLGAAGIPAKPCADMDEVVECVRIAGSMVILTEEALTERGVAMLVDALHDQPSWSEIPILLLLSSRGDPLRDGGRQLVATVRVAILQRPVPTLTLVTTSQTLLSARRRQHEVRELIERERAQRERAEHATRVKDEFLATVSHELRTPLSAILLWSGLLERGQLSSDQAREAVASIKLSAEAQRRLIEDLLDLSRMMMGKLRLSRGRHDVSVLVKAAIDVVTPMAQASNVKLDLDLASEAEALVDPDRIQQIVWNLLVNAIKFTQPGGTVKVRSWRELDQIVLSVIDSGIGIAPELMPSIFDRFRQGDSSAGRRHAGLGVGLPIVKELVQLHGGSIEAKSDGTGHGTTFVIRFAANKPAPRTSKIDENEHRT